MEHPVGQPATAFEAMTDFAWSPELRRETEQNFTLPTYHDTN